MKKLDSIKITKSDEKIIYAIGSLTLKEQKKSTKTPHAKIAQFCDCSEKTVQRAVAKLEKAKLITRGLPRWKKSAWFINISPDFYKQTKEIFMEQEKLSRQNQKSTENVQTGFIIKTSFNNKTKTEIEKSTVQFFISEKILELDLKNLDKQIGLIHSDLEFISRQTGWQNPELQSSIDNFALALETKTFIATKISPREVFISILTGSNGKREPRLFNKPQELVKIEAERANEQLKKETVSLEEIKKIQENKEIQIAKENYWFSISEEKKQAYLIESSNDLNIAITMAHDRISTDHDEFSLSKILENLNALENCKIPPSSTDRIKIKNSSNPIIIPNWKS